MSDKRDRRLGETLVRPARRPSLRWAFARLSEELLPQQSAEAQICRQVEGAHPPEATDETVVVWDFQLHENLLLPALTYVQIARASIYDRWYVFNAYSS